MEAEAAAGQNWMLPQMEHRMSGAICHLSLLSLYLSLCFLLLFLLPEGYKVKRGERWQKVGLLFAGDAHFWN